MPMAASRSSTIRSAPDPIRTERGVVRDPFPDNRIPANLINPIAQKVLALYPSAQYARRSVHVNTRNFNKSGKTITTNDRIDGRIDWAKSEKLDDVRPLHKGLAGERRPGVLWQRRRHELQRRESRDTKS